MRKAAAFDPQWRSCETCSVEELYQTMWREETYQATTVESQDLLKSETEAKEMLNKGSISFPEVWDLVQTAGLTGQRARRDRLLENQEQGSRVQMWDVLPRRYYWPNIFDSEASFLDQVVGSSDAPGTAGSILHHSHFGYRLHLEAPS